MEEIKKGLTSTEAREKLKIYGANKIKEKKKSFFKKISKVLFSPIPLMLLAAAGISYWDKKFFDAYFILSLLGFNFFIGFWQERKADNAIKQLNDYLKIKVEVFRDGKWKKTDSDSLVPGDLLELYMGDIVPADIEITEENNFSLNESSLTGESLPVDKKIGDTAFSGSFVATGKAVGVVSTTGSNTYFGKLFLSLEDSGKKSLLEKDILSIAKFLSVSAVFAVLILTIVFLFKRLDFLEILTLDLSLVIAGIPVALPTIMTLIISLNVLKLAKKNVVVRRLASLEDLANVNLLFTDKTGTITLNKIEVDKIISYKKATDKDVIFYAFLSAINNKKDLINKTIIKKAQKFKVDKRDFEIKDFSLADSSNKHGLATVKYKGQEFCAAVGAPQAIEKLCRISSEELKRFNNDVSEVAKKGYRALAVSSGKKCDDKMSLNGLLLLADNLRPDAKRTIKFLKENGILVKMVTGDHEEIAKRIGEEVGLEDRDIYYEVLPQDKYELVKAAKKDKVVAVNGDGINDLPAVKIADVGFAVKNSVSALKSAADIVLLTSGIAVMGTAIIEARKIFSRLYSYSVYRISESFRIVVTILILGISYGYYPLTPIQLIILTLLNDIPIISLAYNRVGRVGQPARIEVKKRFTTGVLYGMVGVLNSLLFFIILDYFLNVSWATITTGFFLKLTVSGHLLIFIAHTNKRWYKFLPSYQVAIAIFLTQALATVLAIRGFFMPAISWQMAAFVWGWSIIWMQIGDLTKIMQRKLFK